MGEYEDDLFLTLPEGPGPAPDGDDNAIFSVEDIEDLPWDDDRQQALVPDDDFDIEDMPLGDEPEPAVEAPAEQPEPEPEPEPAEEIPKEQPAPAPLPERIQIPEPDPSLPWLERTQAQLNAIRRAREDVELVAQREIDEIVEKLEGGGGGFAFSSYMDRLKTGEYANPARVKKYLTFYFMLTFATLDLKALFQSHNMAVWLWREYSRYIPPACWREYVEKTKRDDSIVLCAETFFKHIHDKYLHYMRDELAKREAAWEAAAIAATAAEDYAHKAVDSTGRLTQGNVDVSRAAREKAKELERRTAYGWRKAMLSYAFLICPALYDIDADGIRKEYAAVCNEFFEKLNEYRKGNKI